ncbi:hypothetical protein MFIFM68171_02852 [Madurella fahalii]|uniref:Uncharacterized protein n=1 Tax=Madurella fahalii TaxID=1157608 RepID=A0ABQ0G4G8_9PEZI
MKLLFLIVIFLSAAVSHPSAQAPCRSEAGCIRPPYQMVHLVFHAAAATYDLTIPSDGQSHPTNNGLNVNLITAPDFNIDQCQFSTHQPATFVWQTTKDNPPVSEYAVGPPQPVDAVTCRGTCIPTYGTCFENNAYIGHCCNGYCAATKCRPWRL